MGTVHQNAEVCLNLEEIAKVRISLGQNLIQLGITGHYHLDVKGNRFRIKRDGRKTGFIARRLNLNLLGSNRAFQRIPGKRLQQQLAGIYQQKASVGLVQSPGLNQCKVGQKSTVLLNAFHTTDQIALGRMIKVDNRRTGTRFVFDDNVYLKLGKFIFLGFIHF